MSYAQEIINLVKEKYSYQPEFIQSVEEVLTSISDFLDHNPQYKNHKILERLIEPDRIISFRVSWVDDKGITQVNKGYRVQFNNALGPYKGGLRFHPSVTESILKFLGFEQTFKNALTTLPMGGGKGGSDFDPKDKSDNEIMHFCQVFISELYKYIAHDMDVPAGDMGVGGKEVAYMFGMYKKLTSRYNGVLTGKGVGWGGSEIRTEATGYGLLYFVDEMLKANKDKIAGKKVLVSGSGNVAQYAVEKALEMGAIVLTMSDSAGFVYAQKGINKEQLEWIKDLKEIRNGRIKEAAEQFGFEYFEAEKPWLIKADIALPCATQNEITKEDAEKLAKNGIKLIAEGANMPSSNEAVEVYKKNNILFAPGKASNAGGVATSGLEMAQNSLHLYWSREEVDSRLKNIMKNIHEACILNGKDGEKIDYVKGANISGFKKVADAMIAQGIV